jgi:ATPase subunit of ABC transporter with duplicated ATPase domains
MANTFLEFQNVTFYYGASDSPIFASLSLHCPPGWTGIVGANGSGKTTLLRLGCGELEPQAGRILGPDRVILCRQRTDSAPSKLAAFLTADDPLACTLRGKLGVGSDWAKRWNTLSHGEQKRAQIGVALWQEPEVLALDEPANHIDLEATEVLARALKTYRGIGLLVSHDRHLLDTFCHQTVIVEPSGTSVRPGGYTKATQLAEAEQAAIMKQRDQAKREQIRLKRETVRRQQKAAQSDKRLSKRNLASKDHDARTSIDAARLMGKDKGAGRQLRQMNSRLQRANQKLGELFAKKKKRLGLPMHGVEAKCNFLFRIPAGVIDLCEARRLEYPELSMAPQERIALTGPNGSGKSTLIRRIVADLTLPSERVVYLAQEVDLSETGRIMEEAHSLSRARLGEVMTVVDLLGSDPDRLITTEEPSPGEIRKLKLALGVAKAPYLIIMDEPTNHLDLPSIECMESALDACPCGLLLVSHDQRFLGRLTEKRWNLRDVEGSNASGPVGFGVKKAHLCRLEIR